jgi:hypothetical protein
MVLPGLLSSFAVDFEARRRLTGITLNYFILSEVALPDTSVFIKTVEKLTCCLAAASNLFADAWLLIDKHFYSSSIQAYWALSPHERLRKRCALDAICLILFDTDWQDAMFVLLGSDSGNTDGNELDPKGFWRVDKDKDPELRHTVLTLIAFHDLEEKIRACDGNREEGIKLFLSQNDGEGWMLPETLCLADYGLGHDDRANRPQPVASRLGPRFFDWQLAQSPEESWRECHLHARNLLGETGYQQLLNDIKSPGEAKKSLKGPEQPSTADLGRGKQGELFD